MVVQVDPPVDVAPGTTGSWQTIDLSTHVESGNTAGALIRVVNTSGSEYEWGTRAPGSSFSVTGVIEDTGQDWAFAAVDSNDDAEVYIGNSAVELWLYGYVKSDEGGYISSPPDITTTNVNQWEDVDISSDTGTDTATVAFVHTLVPSGEVAGQVGFRPNGSSKDDIVNSSYTSGDYKADLMVCDANEVFEAYRGGVCEMYLMGYLTQDVTDTSEADVSIGTSGSYTDIDLSSHMGSGDDFAMLWLHPSNNTEYKWDVRPKGSTKEEYWDVLRGSTGWTFTDSNQVIQEKVENTACDTYVFGSVGEVISEQTITADTASVSVSGPAGTLGLGTATVAAAENAVATTTPTPTVESGAYLDADVGVVEPTPLTPSLTTSGLAVVDADVATLSVTHNEHRLYEQGVGVKDSFEDGDMSEYTGDTGEMSTVNVGSANAIHGDWVLRSGPSTGGDGFSKVTTQSITWTQSTTPLSAYAKTDSTSDGIFQLLFGVQDSDNHYYASVDFGSEALRVGRIENGLRSNLGTDIGFSVSPDTYYRISATRESNDELTVELHDTDGNLVGERTSISDDTTFATETGIGYAFEENSTATLEVDYVVSGSEVVVPADVGEAVVTTPPPTPTGSGNVNVAADTAVLSTFVPTPVVPESIPARADAGTVAMSHLDAFGVTASLGSGATIQPGVAAVSLSGPSPTANASGSLPVRADVGLTSMVGFDAVGIDQFIDLPADSGQTPLVTPPPAVGVGPVSIPADTTESPTTTPTAAVTTGAVAISADTATVSLSGPAASATGHGSISFTADTGTATASHPDAAIGPSPVSVASDVASVGVAGNAETVAFTGAAAIDADVASVGTAVPDASITEVLLTEHVFVLRGEFKTVYTLRGDIEEP
jgi:hypothetical protein